jgi:hypothetical protein
MTRIASILRALILGTAPTVDTEWAAVLDYVDGHSEAPTWVAISERVFAPCTSCGSRRNVSLVCRCGS